MKKFLSFTFVAILLTTISLFILSGQGIVHASNADDIVFSESHPYHFILIGMLVAFVVFILLWYFVFHHQILDMDTWYDITTYIVLAVFSVGSLFIAAVGHDVLCYIFLAINAVAFALALLLYNFGYKIFNKDRKNLVDR